MCNKAPEETSAASVPEEATLHEAKPSDVYADEESAQRIESQAPPAAPVVAQASPKQSRWLKYVSLFLLVFQNSALFLSLRLTATGHEKDDKYASTVVVFIVEIAKLAAAFVLYARQIKMGPLRTTSALWSQRRDMKLLAVPALCYTAQQNLIVMSRDFLSAPAMQVIGQSKTLWTAVFAFVVLKKRFTLIECTSFVLLCIGVVLIEHQDSDSQSEDAAQLAVSSGGRILGVLMSGAAAALSGFAGIFLEKVYTKEAAPTRCGRRMSTCHRLAAAADVAVVHLIATRLRQGASTASTATPSSSLRCSPLAGCSPASSSSTRATS